MENVIHEQVKKQLAYLKYWVDAEVIQEELCKTWKTRYTPSRRKWENIELYEAYKKEIEKNGDKNLLVMVKMRGENGINMYGIYPFARRYAHQDYLVHRTVHGTEILLKEDEVEVQV
jgi:hypothetical protein